MDEYLTKPIEPNDLLRTIHSVLPADRVAEVKRAGVALASATAAATAIAAPATAPTILQKDKKSDGPRRSISNP